MSKMTPAEAGKLGALAAAQTVTAKHQKRLDDWNANPKLCKFCGRPIDYDKRRNDFCGHSCAAAFTNKGVRRHGESPNHCLNCGNDTYNEKFCSQDCMSDFGWKETKTELLATGTDNSDANRQGKRYLIELHEGKCQSCGLDHWLGKPIPLVLDHIDGNPYNNDILNLRVICNNCDAISPTYKGRNKGNGRFKRAERYKYERETVGNIETFRWKH